MTTPSLRAIEDLARDQAARDGLEAQLRQARSRLEEARRRHNEAVALLSSELEDVARLESMSVTRILSALRGNREVDLDREKAEADRASYVAAEAEARRVSAERDVDALVHRIAAYGDLATRREQVLAQREAEIVADPSATATATRLTELSANLGESEAEVLQIDEAVVAAGRAREALTAAQRVLDSAASWATYDTFLGGGLGGDLVKYNRLDRAADLVRAADAALAHLGTELADVGISAVGGVQVDELTRFFDVWFDNLFSDWAVRKQVRRAGDQVGVALGGVVSVQQQLEERRQVADRTRVELAAERERLLVSPSLGT